MDFKRLRAIPILGVCSYLGIELKRNRGRCPLCQRNAFAVTPDKGLWYCFKCHEHGDGLELVVKAKLITHPEAAQLLADAFGGS